MMFYFIKITDICPMAKKKKSFLDKLRKKYTIVIHNELTFEEKGSFSLSKLNLVSLTGVFIIVLFVVAYLVFAYSPLKMIFPWYDDTNYRQTAIENQKRMDSLQKQINQYDIYIHDLKKVIRGEDFDDLNPTSDSSSSQQYSDIDFQKSKEDSLLRMKIENEGISNNSTFNSSGDQASGLLFFTPLRGTISQSYNKSKDHFGVDIVGEKDSPIKAVLDGKVMYTGWSGDDGHVIILNHGGGYVSVYKHNSSLFKSTGDEVNSGDAIAIIGNTGRHSSGSHLHFELWLHDQPIDPQKFISFE